MLSITGSYQKRQGKNGVSWELVAELPRDPITHKRNRRYRTVTCTSEKEAKKALRDFLSEVEGGMYVATNRTTVSQWVQTWLTVYAAPNNSPTTTDRYRGLIRRYIDPTIGNMALQDLNTIQIQAWVNSLKISPSSGKPLSASTIKHAYNIVSEAMDKAVLAEIIVKSPCNGVSLPKGEKKEAVVYDQEQMKLLVATAKGTDMELVIDMELCLGLRRGELLGLEWDDIDWENKTIKIIRTRVIANNEVIVKPPKTPKSIRTLDLPDQLLEKLRLHKAQCAARHLRMGKRYTATEFIFVHPDGQPIYPEYLTQKLTKLQKKADLPHCRFHDLRHLCASIMLLQGVNVKVAQQILGHKDINTTLNIYSHVLPSSVKEASDKVGSFVYEAISG